MTEWRYKWVRTWFGGLAEAGGRPDKANVDRHTQRGWTPVGAGDWPETIDRQENWNHPDLVLYRIEESVIAEREAFMLAEAIRLGDPRTHVAIANANIEAYKKELRAKTGRPDAGKGWSAITSHEWYPKRVASEPK